MPAGRSEEGQEQREEPTKRQERAERILDAAAELLLRWGYKKTTIDDVARIAGVAKGTIYLHWKSREHLFLALLMREKVKVGTEIQQAMVNDPDGVTLHTIVKYATLAALRNPFFKAVMLRDRDMLGELADTHYLDTDIEQHFASYNHFLSHMQENKLIRADVSLPELSHMFASVMMGYILIDQYLPSEFQLSDEKRAELAAETVQRTFELRKPDTEERQVNAIGYDQMIQSMQKYRVKIDKDV